MILTETHFIKRKQNTEELYSSLEVFCFASKNLRNATNYIITQCSRISYKLKQGEILDSWEKALIYKVNCGIKSYNQTRPTKKPVKYIDENNSFVADAYFLSWWLKSTKEYKAMPLATTSQICIQMLCRDWKAFYEGMKAYKKNTSSMLGIPHRPNYYDKETGRNWLVITSQNISRDENNLLLLPKCFDGIKIKTTRDKINQIRIKTTSRGIKIQIMYEKEELKKVVDKNKVMGIDLGVSNLMAVSSNTKLEPFIINGKPLKSMNQYYNKEKARLQEIAKTINNCYQTKHICKLTEVRNNKVKDYLHKASRKIIDIALANQIGTIVIGNNKEWKQEVSLGKVTNQNFVSIPYHELIQMITYKAELVGISVIVVDEKYTSGTSYLDGETPEKKNYNKQRRVKRGLFRSNNGTYINADINASYQMMKKIDGVPISIKKCEKITKIKVA